MILHGGGCGEDAAVLSIAEADGSTYAALVMSEPCAVAALATGAPYIVFRLDGDWESGFAGDAVLDNPLQVSHIEIGPYGDGKEITFQGCLDCYYFGPLDLFFYGKVSDVLVTQ